MHSDRAMWWLSKQRPIHSTPSHKESLTWNDVLATVLRNSSSIKVELKQFLCVTDYAAWLSNIQMCYLCKCPKGHLRTQEIGKAPLGTGLSPMLQDRHVTKPSPLNTRTSLQPLWHPESNPRIFHRGQYSLMGNYYLKQIATPENSGTVGVSTC